MAKFSRKDAFGIIDLIAACNTAGVIASCRRHANRIDREHGRSKAFGSWQVQLRRLADWLEFGDMDSLPSSIFGLSGNDKLPFVTFSVLPIITCPGMGNCELFCYSLKAWRYPAAFVRQCVNTLLLQSAAGRAAIVAALDAIPMSDFVLRLYVDGDVQTVEILKFWMDLIKDRPHVSAYGYSKSFAEFLQLNASGYNWPENYLLNLSSGHNHDSATVELVKTIPTIVRGDFLAVGKKGKLQHGTKAYAAAARQAYHAQYGDDAVKPFVCPGKCGECTKDVHACGSNRFKDIPVVILAH